MARAERCLWCGQVRDDLQAMPHLRQYEGAVAPTHAPIRACPEHAEAANAYLLRAARNSRWTLAASVLAMILFIGGGMAEADAIVASGLVVLGAGILMFPFCTPAAVRRLGARRAIGLARALGVVFGIAGLAGVVYSLPGA